MKIGYVTSSFPRYNGKNGGLFIYNQVKLLAENNEVHVIYPTKKRVINDELDNLYLHEIDYPFKSYTLTQINWTEYIQLLNFCKNYFVETKKNIKNHDIDILHSHWTIPSGFITSLNSDKVPQVITIHGSDLKVYAKKNIYRPLVKYAIKKADEIIVVSNDLKELAISMGCNPDKLHVIPNGVNTNVFKHLNKKDLRKKYNVDSSFLITYIGNLVKIKRVDILIKICKDLLEDYDLDLLIVGEGPEREYLEAYATSINMKNITFRGTIDHNQVPYYIAISDVVALTSESEGLPTILVEAMSCGVPVITTNVGGVSDIITDGVNGFIANNYDEYRTKLEYIIKNNVRDDIGKNARNFILNNHSIEEVCLKIQNLYEKLAN